MSYCSDAISICTEIESRVIKENARLDWATGIETEWQRDARKHEEETENEFEADDIKVLKDESAHSCYQSLSPEVSVYSNCQLIKRGARRPPQRYRINAPLISVHAQ